MIKRLGERGADRVPRVQRAVGVLEHHLHVAAVGLARGLAHRLAADLDPAGPGVEQQPDALQDRGLARARLADEAEALARADREADVVEDLPRLVAEAEGDGQAVDRDVAHGFTSASGRFQLSSRRSTASGARLAADVRLRGDEAARVVVPGVPELRRRQRLDHLARVHDQHAVAEVADEVEVVADHDQPDAALAHQRVEDAEHLHPHRHVERRGRLVGDDHLRLRHQHHRDHHPLAHAARDLVRIEPVDPLGVADLHRLEHLQRLLPRLAPRAAVVHRIGLGDLVADALHRVQRELRVLQDHRDPRAADVEHPPLRGAGSGRSP